MGLGAGDLRNGLSVAFRSVKKGVPDFFLQGRPDGTVFPTKLMTDRGTEWLVQETANPGIFRFECREVSLLLEGNASGCSVRVASGSSLGMNWRVRDFSDPDLGGFGHVSLQLQSQGGGCSSGFLDIWDQELRSAGLGGLRRFSVETDSVRLAPESSSGTAAHWELILLPVGSETGGATLPGTGTLPA